MSAVAVGLVLISAILHAGWNFFGQRSAPAAAYFFVAILSAALVGLPVIPTYWSAILQLPAQIWLLLLATGLFQAVAYTGLSGAYRRGALSLTYPVARALPIPLLALAGFALGRGQAFTTTGLLGMLLVAGGCFILPIRDLRTFHPSDYLQPAVLMASMAALGIVGYTLIDGDAMRLLRQMPSLGLDNLGLALVYLEFETLTTLLALGAYVLGRPAERQRLAALLSQRTGRGLNNPLVLAAVTGVVLNLSYVLILIALAFARDIAYVVAFRQLSIPLGAILGMVIQKEPAFPPKIAGIAIVTVGLLLIAL